ncbi:hypothetical protein [Lysinibacillus sphaericus]|uniref:hypothetical protein n=1 Tax=Lysinibacillus sphaericus TaxID=1421 RepID=UPI001CC05861|nr:hypothetical protein [Lysinibacillus sphaericus]
MQRSGSVNRSVVQRNEGYAKAKRKRSESEAKAKRKRFIFCTKANGNVYLF